MLLSVAQLTILPPSTLVFVPTTCLINDENSFTQYQNKHWVVKHTYSAEPGAEWVIPNCILTDITDHFYLPVLNSSLQPITFHTGVRIAKI